MTEKQKQLSQALTDIGQAFVRVAGDVRNATTEDEAFELAEEKLKVLRALTEDVPGRSHEADR
jgi:hypothetical protein